MRAQWWLIGVASVIALGVTGCGQPAAASHKQPALTAAGRVRVRIINGMDLPGSPQPITQAARRHSVTAAIRMVTSAIVPPGSRGVVRLAAKALTEPAQVSACDPIVDATTLWLVSGSAGNLTTFLVQHVPQGLTNDESGSSTSGEITTSYSVADIPGGKHPSQSTLIFTFAPVGRATGLRVDALTIPSGAACMSSAGGAAVRSSHAPAAGGS